MARASRKISRKKRTAAKTTLFARVRERIRAVIHGVALEVRAADVIAVCIFGVIEVAVAAFGYVPFIIAAVMCGACVAYVCGKNVREGSLDAMPKFISALVYSLLAGIFVCVGTLIRGAGAASLSAAAASALAILYVTMLLECALCKNAGRKRISVAISFTGLYLPGVPLLLAFVFLASRVRLVDDGDGGFIVTPSAIAKFAALYDVAVALRLVYVYIILRRRLRQYAETDKT